jgi:hypothetical protein
MGPTQAVAETGSSDFGAREHRFLIVRQHMRKTKREHL